MFTPARGMYLAILISASGCGNKPNQSPPPPPPPPVIPAQATAPGALAGATAPANVPVQVDPVAEAKMQKEQQDALAARIKAGEIGTTPDPVVDRMKEYLNTSYQNYFSAYNKAPATMEDMVRAGYMKSVPPLPAGKKYKIDPNGAGITVVDGR